MSTGYTRQCTNQRIVHEGRNLLRVNATIFHIRSKDFKEVIEPTFCCFATKLSEGQQTVVVGLEIIVKGDRVEAQIDDRFALDRCALDRCDQTAILCFTQVAGPIGTRRLVAVICYTTSPNVGRVVGPNRRVTGLSANNCSRCAKTLITELDANKMSM